MKATKTIMFMFQNRSSKATLTMSVPFFPHKATDGFYSALYKRSKKALEPKSGFYMIAGKKWFIPKKSDRAVFEFDNGIIMDIPFEITKQDLKIICHYLEGVKMALKK